jgi:hypothetical protein
MIKQLNVFLLLPEAQRIHDFFHTAYDFVEEASLRDFLIELKEALEWVYREKNATSFYSVENVRHFLNNFEDFKDDYLFDPASKVGDILANAYNWQENKQQERNCSYFIWHGQSANLVANHVLSELAERQKKSPNQSFLLFNFNAASFQSKIITILKEIWEDNQLLLLPTFNQVDTEQELYAWLKKERQKRNFNLNPKHGENDTAAHIKSKNNEVSPLSCNKNEAQELLNTAIGDIRQTTQLYNFDRQHQKYIVFKFENETPQNQYHGYHPINQDEVPHSFKQLIQKIGQV